MMKRVFGILLAAALLLGAAGCGAKAREESAAGADAPEPQPVVPDHGKGPLRRAGDGDDDLQKADELRGRDLPVAREHPGHQDDLLYRQGDRPVRGPQLRLHARQRARARPPQR